MSHAFDPARLRPVSLRFVAAALGIDGASLPDVPITGVAVSTGDVRPGSLFVAHPGAHGHGADHVTAAREAGAIAVLTDQAGTGRASATGLPVITVTTPRHHLGEVAALVYGTAHPPFPLFGVTGTNGKTSTVYVLDALMRRLGWRTALTSTAERKVVGHAAASRLTTPEAPELHALLARAAEEHVSGAAIEVSAQALSRRRVDGVRFDIAGFTNLSHDHLDDYADMDEYLAAKAQLFTPTRARRGVVSVDSPAGRRIAAEASIPVTTITTEDRTADWRVHVLEQRHGGTRFRLAGPDGVALETEVPLLGVHMAGNAGLAIAMLLTGGVPARQLRTAVGAGLNVVVPGRMADASAPAGPRVYVDFAHTPDAFEKSLAAIRAFTAGPVAIVLGADGDRDRTKRAPMGAVAARGAEVVVVTDHHPRFEDPDPIRAAILAGARSAGGSARIIEEPDPARAIRIALAEVGAHGAVYWAGPGLTDYRDIRGVHVPYSSFRDAQAALAEAGWSAGTTVGAST